MKGLLCFCGILFLIFPLFNIKKNDVFSMDNVCDIFFVRWEDDKQIVLRQEKNNFSQKELAKNAGVILVVKNSSVEAVCNFLGLQEMKMESFNDENSVFGWTDLYGDFIWLNGKQTNVQVLEKEDEIIVGFPIILSGF